MKIKRITKKGGAGFASGKNDESKPAVPPRANGMSIIAPGQRPVVPPRPTRPQPRKSRNQNSTQNRKDEQTIQEAELKAKQAEQTIKEAELKAKQAEQTIKEAELKANDFIQAAEAAKKEAEAAKKENSREKLQLALEKAKNVLTEITKINASVYDQQELLKYNVPLSDVVDPIINRISDKKNSVERIVKEIEALAAPEAISSPSETPAPLESVGAASPGAGASETPISALGLNAKGENKISETPTLQVESKNKKSNSNTKKNAPLNKPQTKTFRNIFTWKKKSKVSPVDNSGTAEEAETSEAVGEPLGPKPKTTPEEPGSKANATPEIKPELLSKITNSNPAQFKEIVQENIMNKIETATSEQKTIFFNKINVSLNKMFK